MSENKENNKYESLKIPDQNRQVDRAVDSSSKTSAIPQSSPSDMFYEIEYNSSLVSGVGKFVLKPQVINKPEKDEIRDLFIQMRDIAREQRSTYDYSRFFDRNAQHDNAIIFYKQGMFMKDYEDNYSGNVPFSQYFPYYQMLGYEQLRTYFSWRTKVKHGNITDTSLSYAFLYIYELLNNIGVKDPQDGINKLMIFWKAFRINNKSIDTYVLRWLKDYHIYYNLPQSLKEFAKINNLSAYYPEITESDDDFNLFCSVSKYDIRKSVFFADETRKLIIDCFSYLIEKIRKDFDTAGMNFDDVLFRPTRTLVFWKPFKDALFYNWLKQPDRRTVLSKNEIYICNKNEWSFSTIITTEKGRQFIGYVLKHMETILRQVTKFKFKLTSNIDMINQETMRKLKKAGLFIDKIVFDAVMNFYKEVTKTVITVDPAALARIRQEALVTQESLIVEDQIEQRNVSLTQTKLPPDNNIFADSSDSEPVLSVNIWESLRVSLNDNEIKSLAVIAQGGDIKSFADECGIMLEVLVDGINEKAMDCISDNLIDDNYYIYDDYIQQVKDLIK